VQVQIAAPSEANGAADAVQEALKRSGFRARFGRGDTAPGILEGIRLLLLVLPESPAAAPLPQEVGLALHKGIPVLPFRAPAGATPEGGSALEGMTPAAREGIALLVERVRQLLGEGN
jgi:hypothetical protein